MLRTKKNFVPCNTRIVPHFSSRNPGIIIKLNNNLYTEVIYMYNFLSLTSGLVVAVLVFINGALAQAVGVFNSTVIIHIVGVIFALLICIIGKYRIRPAKGQPLWLYLGGALGFLTTVFNNFAFGKISVTSIIALGLAGQMITALIIDTFGLFGMKKHPFRKSSLAGLAFAIAGIAVMLDTSVANGIYAVFFSLAGGITVVLARTVNARLSHHTGEIQSSFFNHIVGLFISIIAAVIVSEPLKTIPVSAGNLWIFTGGTFGVITVLIYNITVPKVPAFRLTLLSFVGQVFTGIIIDLLSNVEYSKTSFLGALLVTGGIILNMFLEQKYKKTV